MPPYYVIKSLTSFKKYYRELKSGDLILTRLPLKKEDFALVVDLIQRGVLSFPSFLSQILSKSKCAQVDILGEFMPPHTYVIRNKLSLLEVMAKGLHPEKWVTKKDQANCGLGIHLWRDLEEIYNHAGTPLLDFPFVLQPFYTQWQDVRVILLGDLYYEAYIRENPKNFRQNLFFGGKAHPYELSFEELTFCKAVMNRGGFPYAHLDIAYIEGRGPYLIEINLCGGIKGAQIKTEEYENLKRKIEELYLENWKLNHSPFVQL
ncbi:MAG: hypothetical protein N2327_04335 [Caldimicrobium sp.]|nr:hypothetical protein [Caldimicrobium sp.]MCX7873643.1 hypothetical protein [Caldimicrobium sp.]MDW8094334.1 hypothetical protein [Caldimicrobium sp.]